MNQLIRWSPFLFKFISFLRLFAFIFSTLFLFIYFYSLLCFCLSCLLLFIHFSSLSLSIPPLYFYLSTSLLECLIKFNFGFFWYFSWYFRQGFLIFCANELTLIWFENAWDPQTSLIQNGFSWYFSDNIEFPDILRFSETVETLASLFFFIFSCRSLIYFSLSFSSFFSSLFSFIFSSQ